MLLTYRLHSCTAVHRMPAQRGLDSRAGCQPQLGRGPMPPFQEENAYVEAVLAPSRQLQARLFQEMLGRIPRQEASAPQRRGQYWYYRWACLPAAAAERAWGNAWQVPSLAATADRAADRATVAGMLCICSTRVRNASRGPNGG